MLFWLGSNWERDEMITFKQSALAAIALAVTSTQLNAVAIGISGTDTPETIGLSVGIGNAFPSNTDNTEYYAGEIAMGDSVATYHTGAVFGADASLAWFKFTSDGVSDIIIDTFGSTAAFGFGGFTGTPSTELAIFDSDGNLVLKQSSVRAQAEYEPSNVEPDANGLDATLPAIGNRVNNSPYEPLDPIARGYTRSGLALITAIDEDGNVTLDPAGFTFSEDIWLSNQRGTSQIAFVKNPAENPLWDPSHPDYDPDADWDQYAILPAGDYFIALTGAARFSGFDPDMLDKTPVAGDYVANGNVNQKDGLIPDDGAGGTVRFGFTSIHANDGIMYLNLRKPGDFSNNSSTDATDIDLLFDRIAELSGQGLDPTTGVTLDGLPLDFLTVGADNWEPEINLSASDTVMDLTGNSRIDMGDMCMLIYNILDSEFGDANLDGVVDDTDKTLVQANLGTAGGWADGDFNGDDIVDQLDMDILLASIPGLDGDLNSDGFVGLDDLDIVLSNWNQNVTAGDPLLGDPSGDGFVGLDDLDIILGNWNAGTPPTAVVPEPAVFACMSIGLLGIMSRRRMN